jgi:hydrogenase maturation factor
MEISNRILFFKYALPCAETLIKRENLSPEEFDKMLTMVASGKEPEKNSENFFKVAMAHLRFISMQKKKDEIDEDAIREYFLFEHDETVDERFDEMGDFDQEKCRTYPGIVKEIKDGKPLVETPIGIESCRNDFVKDLKVKDIVVVHRSFVVEKISKGLAVKMMKSKKHLPNLKNIFS